MLTGCSNPVSNTATSTTALNDLIINDVVTVFGQYYFDPCYDIFFNVHIPNLETTGNIRFEFALTFYATDGCFGGLHFIYSTATNCCFIIDDPHHYFDGNRNVCGQWETSNILLSVNQDMFENMQHSIVGPYLLLPWLSPTIDVEITAYADNGEIKIYNFYNTRH